MMIQLSFLRCALLLLQAVLLLGVADAFHLKALLLQRGSSASRRQPPPPLTTALLSDNRGGDSTTNDEKKDYCGEASSLFSNIRIPAALFAGASAANAFALPLLEGDTLAVGLTKRLYALLMISALSSELLAIIVSTTSMSSIAYYKRPPTSRLDEFITQYYELEWITVVANFIFGMLAFVCASGIRARITIACPVVARSALGIIISSTLLALSFLNDTYKQANENLLSLPINYSTYLVKKARKDPLFFVSVVGLAATYGYILYKIPHVWHYLAKK